MKILLWVILLLPWAGLQAADETGRTETVRSGHGLRARPVVAWECSNDPVGEEDGNSTGARRK